MVKRGVKLTYSKAKFTHFFHDLRMGSCISTKMSEDQLRPSSRFPIRYIVVLVVLMASTIEYVCRYNINVSMVAMVKQQNLTEDDFEEACPIPFEKLNETTIQTHGSYDWDSETQGIILGAFFYTYTALQIPSGRLAEVFGGKWIVAFSLLGSGILNLLTPLLTSSVWLMVASRLILGLLQCGLFPACFAIIFNWFPLKERSVAYAALEIGTMLGSVWAAGMAGYLAEHGFAGGWPSTFYVSGTIAVISFFIWTPFITSSPEEHRLMSVTEIKDIRRDSTLTKSVEVSVEQKTPKKKKKRAVPWLAIFTNKAVLANVFSKFFLRWTFYTLVMKLPTYLHDVLHLSPTKNGIINASMYLVAMIPMLVVGYVSEQLIIRKYLTRTNCRKVFVSCAAFGSAICVACVPSFGCNSSAVIGLLLAGNLFQAFDGAGNICNPGELSKHYATTIFAIVNMLNTSIGFIVPYLIGIILKAGEGRNPLDTWSFIFYLASGLSVLSGVIYLIFGSGERQRFDYGKLQEEEDDDDEEDPESGDGSNSVQSH